MHMVSRPADIGFSAATRGRAHQSLSFNALACSVVPTYFPAVRAGRNRFLRQKTESRVLIVTDDTERFDFVEGFDKQ